MSNQYQISLTAEQVFALYEMCEFCGGAIHRMTDDDAPIPESYALVNSIMSKLDGCEDLGSEVPSILDLAKAVKRLEEKPFPDWMLPELNPRTVDHIPCGKRTPSSGDEDIFNLGID